MTEFFDREPEFWLPAEFLTDEDILMGNQENPNNLSIPSKSEKITTLPYYLSGSPQSTLFQLGGYSSRSSASSNDTSPIGTSQVTSPTSRFAASGDSLDLIYQAAAQVSKLKMNGCDVSQRYHHQESLNNSSDLYNSFVQRVREELILKYQEHQRRNVWANNQSKADVIFQQHQKNGLCGLNVGAYLENDQSAWPSLQYVMQKNIEKRSGNQATFPGGGSGNGYFTSARKPSAGTGVFLPRPYGGNVNEKDFVGFQNRNKKTGCSTTSIDGMGERKYPHVNGGGRSLPQRQPTRGGGFCSDYEIQLAHKKAMLMHQRSSHLQHQVALGHELGLPQEWTY